MIHMQLEQFDQALDWFRRALEVNPNMVGVEAMVKEIADRSKLKRMRFTGAPA
jgi:hypothetical protein